MIDSSLFGRRHIPVAPTVPRTDCYNNYYSNTLYSRIAAIVKKIVVTVAAKTRNP